MAAHGIFHVGSLYILCSYGINIVHCTQGRSSHVLLVLLFGVACVTTYLAKHPIGNLIQAGIATSQEWLHNVFSRKSH